MKQKIQTQPSLLDTAPLHQQAIIAGDQHYKSWQYNVIDKFKDLEPEEIKLEIKKTCLPYAICFENVIQDYNMSCGMRSANGLGAKEIFYLGNKRFDKRALVGIHNYSDITWIPTIEDFLKLKDNYRIVGFDNIEGSVALNNYQWSPTSMMVFGSESVGLTPKMLSMCDDIVHIEQRGSVRSLNVATAAGIAMYDYTTKFFDF